MENFLIKSLRIAMGICVIAFPLIGFVWGGMARMHYNDDWLVGAVPGAIVGFIVAALSFGVVAVLLKIEQNTRPQ